MRRSVLVTAVVAVLLLLGLWGVAAVDRGALEERRRKPRIPQVASRAHMEPEDLDDVADEADPAVIRCAWEGEGEGGRLLATDAEGRVATPSGDLALVVPPGTWMVVWERDGGRARGLGTVEVDAGETVTCRLDQRGYLVRGSVHGHDGRPVAGAQVGGCGAGAETDEDGAFAVEVGRAPCSLRAWWVDGAFQRPGEAVEIASAFETAEDVELEVDDRPIAGMGVGFRMEPDGARVGTVHPGTPAAAAGMRHGDLIVAVDREPVAGLDAAEFVRRGTGVEGSTIEVEVEREGERRTFTFRRSRLELPEDTGR